jgi:tetratricopeptide (TPR) repeat protein
MMKIKSLLTSTVFSVILFLVMSVNARSEVISEQMTVRPGRTVTSGTVDFIASTALKAYLHIAEARSGIHAKDVPHAKEELTLALGFIDIIKTALPTVKTRDLISVAQKHLYYEEMDNVIPDLVPIYDSLADIQDLVPVERARELINRAKEDLKKGDRAGAARELTSADKSLIYTEMDLPISYVEKKITAARDFLAINSSGKADESLVEAEDGLRFLSIDIYAPLARAKRSLWQASRSAAAGDRTAAINYLKEARSSLGMVVTTGDDRVRTESQELLKGVGRAESKMNEDGGTFRVTVKSLWQRSKALYDLTAERVSTGWRQLESRDPLKTKLMDIKLYVAYAETYQLTAGEPDEALSEIDKALEYISRHPMSGAGEATEAQLSEIEKELKDMKTLVMEKDTAVKILYEDIKSQLEDLMQNP